ncbi:MULTISPECIES: aspartate/glutamate racemase family protein [Cytobacillus]|uniref:aspartate/glutamate racemase family protein n=1 Tax=Cytobacillus TaxID=2675230 RepID=UPI001CD3F490|nr:aspartate/glutamate racemase family protein [Cytobacillus kochii]MCA1026415.1 aspartate/glutamate racemase family protein [Cytobacillus kochii]MCM3322438.1 aspartate/glutamate racemase family protein [Cytobacillus kochii]MCM3345084.1 aspartate/glutamate racemase family protein [Cytobacillus kochii]MDM5209639.1 aspartate/glutamate racemase family protein [Cytobacillus kochii]
MKVALIHATTTALKPIEEAFRKVAPEVELLHFMDTHLLTMIEESGSLTPEIARRFSKSVSLAAEARPDCIQLTCSAFNPLTAILQPLCRVKMFRSDEAMLDEALEYNRIGLISTVRETPEALINYLQARQPNCAIESVVDPGIIHLLFEGKKEEHDERVRRMVAEMDGKVDVIVLSQYSMAHVANQVTPSTPILVAPEATAKRCFQYILQK